MFSFLFSSVNQYSQRLNNLIWWAFENAQNTVKRAAVFLATGFVILWIALLLYASFYHVHVPSESVIRPAHFKFRVCPAGVGMCSFPMANITLGAGGRAEVLGRGQRYRIFLDMEVPDSTSNRDIGMFMIIMKVYDRHGDTVQQSSRTAALKYQSDLLYAIQTLFWSPLYVTGFLEQKQKLSIELFEEYLDDVYHPAVGVLIEIHSRQLELYSADLKFHATYTGLRYYMFYWPLTSAFFGIIFNCLWLSLVAVLSWYKLGAQPSPDTAEGTRRKQLTFEEREERVNTIIGEDRPAERGYIQPFRITPSPRDAETVGEVWHHPREHPDEGGDSPELLQENISGYIQPFAMTSSQGVVGATRAGSREELCVGDDRHRTGQQDTSLLRLRGRPESAT